MNFARFRLPLCALLGALVLTACGQEQITEGIEVGVQATNTRAAAAKLAEIAPKHETDPTTQTFLRAEGQRFDLQKGFVNLLPLELVSCPALVAVDGFGSWLSEAYAHGEGERADPAIVDVSRADGTQWALGSLSAVPGRYCGLRLRLVAVQSPTAAPDEVDMSGASVYLAPCYFYESAGDPASTRHYCFSLHLAPAAGEQERVLPFAEPLMLDSVHREANVAARLRYDGWFDGLPLDGYPASGTAEEKAAFRAALQDNEGLKARLIDNFWAAVTLQVD